MAETPIIVNGIKSLVYDLEEKYELHILKSDNLSQTDICNVVYYLCEEGFLPDNDKALKIILIPKLPPNIEY